MLWKSPSIEEWRFLTLILRCWPMWMWRSYGKRNRKHIQKISYIRFNPKWMTPFRLMVDVDVRKQYYADYILVTLFKLIFYLLKGEEPPVCIPCDRLCSIEHLLTGCVDLIEWRRHFFKTESLSVLFRECSPNSIIQFLKCTNLFNKLWWHYCAPWFYYCDSHSPPPPPFFFKNFVILIILKNPFNKPKFYFVVMSELWSVYRLEITVPVGWALNTNN